MLTIRGLLSQGRYISDITLEEVQQYTNLPAHVACERLGLGLTSFKRLCRALGISAWPYKKDPSITSNVYATDYASGPFDGHMNTNIAWNQQHDGAFPIGSRPAVNLSSYLQNPSIPSQYTYSPPPLPPIGQVRGGHLLHDLCRDATPTSLAQLMSQIKHFSAEMRDVLGISIINDEAVDLILSACAALEAANRPPPPPPPPPAENSPAAALMAILAQVRGSLH